MKNIFRIALLPVRCRCLFGGFAFAASVAGAACVDLDPADYWNTTELFRTPACRACPDSESESSGLRPLLIEGRGPNGTKAEFFAYYGCPKGPVPKGGFPGVVLVHGGGGTAYPHYTKHWINQGFAVIAPDWYNCRPAPGATNAAPTEISVPRVPLSGGKRQDHVATVANLILAHSLLRSFPEVNAERTVYVGLSWGSWYGSCVTAADHRFKGACMIYLADRNPNATADVKSSQFVRGPFHKSIRVPMWWIVWTNDSNGTPETMQEAWDVCSTDVGRTVVPNLGHSHEGFYVRAVDRMAKYFTGGAKRLPLLSRGELADGVFRAKILDPGKGVAEAQLWYSLDAPVAGKANAKTVWQSVPAEIRGRVVSAKLPKGTTRACLTAYEAEQVDKRRRYFCGSSGFVFP